MNDKPTTLYYSPYNGQYDHLVMINRIVRLSKSNDGEITFIHLDTGEILESTDSIKTINARING